MTTQELDKAKVEAFAGQMIGFLNGAQLALMTSVGYRTGLIDSLAGMPPATSAEIARHANLNERYVREWLGAMVCGGVVTYNPTDRPTSCRQSTRRSLRARRVLRIWRSLPHSSRSWPRSRTASSTRSGTVVGCPTPSFPEFQRMMAQVSGQVFDATLLQRDARARARSDRPPQSGNRRRRHRLRVRPRDQPDGAGVPHQPLHGLRLFSRRHCCRSGGGETTGHGERALRRAGRRAPRCGRRLRFHHRLRRHPRPGAAPSGVAEHRPRAARAAGRSWPST